MRVLTIDVGFDLICPWCWIGKRQLTHALQALLVHAPDVQPSVRWLGQVLLPNVPEQGWPFQEFYVQRLGSPQAVAQRRAQVRAAGEVVGLSFDFERIEVMPSTRLAHRMVAQTAVEYGTEQAGRLIEALFVAYFQQGKDIGQRQVLAQIANELLLDETKIISTDASSMNRDQTQPQLLAPGVPHFVINGNIEVNGAVHHEVLLNAMLQALAA